MKNYEDIKNYEGFYKINKKGKVISCEREIKSSFGATRIIKERVAGIIIGNHGYYCVDLSKYGVRKRYLLHRLLAIQFIENKNGKPCINHKDGNRKNNKLNNLEWCTYKENIIHAYKIGLFPKSKIGPGERSPAAKLNNEKVLEIREMLFSGAKKVEIAKIYHVTIGTICFISDRKTWAHI